MNDRELLELAAKAAGLHDAKFQDMGGWGDIRYGFDVAMWSEGLYDEYGSGYWNPLADDGDALRLAVALRLTVAVKDHEVEVFTDEGDCIASVEVLRMSMVAPGHSPDDVASVARRAIVRAAAEIGKQA